MVFAKCLREKWCFLSRNCNLVFSDDLAFKLVVFCNLLVAVGISAWGVAVREARARSLGGGGC